MMVAWTKTIAEGGLRKGWDSGCIVEEEPWVLLKDLYEIQQTEGSQEWLLVW